VNPQRAGPEEIFVLGSDAGVPESEIVAFKRSVRAAGGRCVTPDQLWESVIFGEVGSSLLLLRRAVPFPLLLWDSFCLSMPFLQSD
jgi:hypothetical protein